MSSDATKHEHLRGYVRLAVADLFARQILRRGADADEIVRTLVAEFGRDLARDARAVVAEMAAPHVLRGVQAGMDALGAALGRVAAGALDKLAGPPPRRRG